MGQPPPSGDDASGQASQAPTPVPPWRRTTRWQPSRSGTASTGAGAGPVEHSTTGERGYRKTTYVAQERIASQLAREVDVTVREFRLGTLDGHAATVGVSIAFGSESLDLAGLQDRSPALYNSQPVQDAIRQASGLLPFHAWLDTQDLKDEHLVIADRGDGSFHVGAIDFSYSMKWTDPTAAVQPPGGPPALAKAPDKGIIAATVARIEACSDERIAEIVNSLPVDTATPSDRERIMKGLQARRAGVREAMRTRGWLP